jgi:hypothetical protein
MKVSIPCRWQRLKHSMCSKRQKWLNDWKCQFYLKICWQYVLLSEWICRYVYCSANCICYMNFLTGTVCSWTDCCSGNTAELYLEGTQFQSVEILVTIRFPSLLPDKFPGNSDKSWLCMSKILTSQQFNNHHKFWHCILWSNKNTVKLVYYNNNIDALIGEWKRLHNKILWSVLRTKYYLGD